MSRAPWLVAIYGPTASGKTWLAESLADRRDTRIVNADAFQVCKGLDIGTAKPGLEETDRVPHHLLNLVSPQAESSLDLYLKAAADVLNRLAKTGKSALFVGGSPLYLKACLRGLSDLPGRDDAIRDELQRQAEIEGVTTLHRRLAEIDPETASKIASTDLRRVVRALEIHAVTGTAPSRLRGMHEKPAPVTVPVLAILRERKTLYERIDRRVEVMFQQGLLEEARNLPQPLSRSARQAVGYAEAFDFLQGKTTIEDAIARTQLRTRHYAKHQLTWFRRLEEVRGVRIDGANADEIVERLVRDIEACRAGNPPAGDQIT